MATKIEWVQGADGERGMTWNPIRGCSRISPGCGGGGSYGGTAGQHGGCYAEGIAARFSGPGQPFHGFAEMTAHGPRWTGKVALIPEKLAEPLRRKKPTTWFLSMFDPFHEALTNEEIDQLFAVMTLAHWHTFQVLTKRADRMAAYFADQATPGRVARASDRISVSVEIEAMPEERIVPIVGYDGYFVSDRGVVYSGNGSASCVHCGGTVSGTARKKYCGKKCRQNAIYHRRVGHAPRHPQSFTPMAQDVGEKGHRRVTLYKAGEGHRELVHRLVLQAFGRQPVDGEQGCHRDGDPGNNALPNLRWGSQAENWEDRKRHGNARSYAKLSHVQVDEIRRDAAHTLIVDLATRYGVTDTQIRNIVSGRHWENAQDWLPPWIWCGCSVESRKFKGRIDHLRSVPAAVRFLSLEPLLEDLGELDLTGIHQVIAGAESGLGARPMREDWVRSIRDQAKAQGVQFFYKQRLDERGHKVSLPLLDGRSWAEMPARAVTL